MPQRVISHSFSWTLLDVSFPLRCALKDGFILIRQNKKAIDRSLRLRKWSFLNLRWWRHGSTSWPILPDSFAIVETHSATSFPNPRGCMETYWMWAFISSAPLLVPPVKYWKIGMIFLTSPAIQRQASKLHSSPVQASIRTKFKLKKPIVRYQTNHHDITYLGLMYHDVMYHDVMYHDFTYLGIM